MFIDHQIPSHQNDRFTHLITYPHLRSIYSPNIPVFFSHILTLFQFSHHIFSHQTRFIISCPHSSSVLSSHTLALMHHIGYYPQHWPCIFSKCKLTVMEENWKQSNGRKAFKYFSRYEASEPCNALNRGFVRLAGMFPLYNDQSMVCDLTFEYYKQPVGARR